MTSVNKGKISSFEAAPVDRNGDAVLARVLPATADKMPTRPLVISWYLRGPMGNLKVGDDVWFALADDLSGIIFERCDGEWTGIIPGDVEITGNELVDGDSTTVGLVTADDVKTSAVASQNAHVHGNGHEGGDTTAPTG